MAKNGIVNIGRITMNKKIILFVCIFLAFSLIFTVLALADSSESQTSGSGGGTTTEGISSSSSSQPCDEGCVRIGEDGGCDCSANSNYEDDSMEAIEAEIAHVTCPEQECEDEYHTCEDGTKFKSAECMWDSEACSCRCKTTDFSCPKTCDGCLLNENCVTFGFRDNGKYCDLSKDFVA
ncbi:hypothetical protein CO154_00010 [Candidatus Pacearchaeota archaeon CG_4_9_14_3_um_filter_31_7]|nr:MAG: hypothetical protein AUJ10_00575 [Candidatus Pacearchaeota archaeon CG1_02_31_27]PIN92312.1 MAG: hypothetical protein COU55_00675 [Candidatus Pacearchaeota archaeon CG10_big_fil_rev_8_21_14_0_10_31_59]PIZ79980.1 MAG: hypothetical protein COX99_03315 [Candidatus Pacearchaeota archaeon CG_4_10_14_0_2_um_filter_31_10]PJA70960.1 MAG: hypothetical protein CO154_00010 [Candidatus Pacearchaeota archaeon CG_4_9_14_3_um_filter_31_7]